VFVCLAHTLVNRCGQTGYACLQSRVTSDSGGTNAFYLLFSLVPCHELSGRSTCVRLAYGYYVANEGVEKRVDLK